ncbi:MAG: hypothetical protein RLZZ626_844 [Actinomycetota bacterium]
MTEVNCEETKRQVHEYLHSALSKEEIDNITDHIANCDSCESDYDFEHLFNKVVKRACDEAPPAELAERILSRLKGLINDAGEVAHE